MKYLIYGSSATELFSEDQLNEILSKSRENNHKLGVTGLLLYADRNFIQVIEGEATVIDNLYMKIKQDPRHHFFMELFEQEIQTRSFPEWTMGFNSISKEEYSAITGFEQVSGIYSKSMYQIKETPILILLQSFLKVNAKDARYL